MTGAGHINGRCWLSSRDDSLCPPLQCLECLSAQTFDAVSTAVAHVSFDGHILRANERFSKLLGYPSGELAGMPISEICVGYDAAAEQEFLRRLPNDRLAIHSITRALRRRDREIVYLPIEVSQVRTHEQAASCVLWVVDEPRDVKPDLGIEQIALNVSVETGESFFRSLLLNVTSALNVDMAFIGEIAHDARTAVQTVVACDRGEFIPNFRYELANSPCELVIGRQICAFPSGVTKLFPRDEGLIHLQIDSYIGAPLFDSTHVASGILVILDRKPLVEQAKAEALIRIFAPRVAAELERHRTEIELRRNERSLVEAQRLGRIGSWEWDVVHGTLRLSEVARELYGQDFESPDKLIELIHEDDREAMRVDADRLATEGVRLDTLFRFPGGGGQFRIFHGRGAAVRDESGRIVATRGTVQDVTERELADATVRMLSQAVEQSGEQVVITDTHSRVEYVNAAFEAQTGFSLADVLGTSLLKLRAANPAEDATFQAMLDATREGRPVGGVFECQRKSGETYFAELRAPSGTSVEIEPLERDGATPIAGCAVLDRGAGFNPDDMAHVFQPFFTRRRGGTGLGLSIVQRIVEQHGGQISVSNREGGGGRVEVVFPRISEEAGA
ncbi:MAG: PAS domain S-box protein [Thermoanaerobaculia bacterium]